MASECGTCGDPKQDPKSRQCHVEDRHHAAATWRCHSTSLCLQSLQGYRRRRNGHIGATNATNATGQVHPHNAQDAGCPTEDKHIDVDNAPLWAHPLGHMCLPLIFTFGSWAAQIFAQTIHEWIARGDCYEEGNPESHCAQHDANCTNSFTLLLQSTTAQCH